MRLHWFLAFAVGTILAGSACSSSTGSGQGDDGGTPPAGKDGSPTMDAETPLDGGSAEHAEAGNTEASAPCTTRVTYGSAWIHGANHPASFDDAPGKLTWDGTCTDEGPNSYALLSNGWKPYFQGNGA